MKIAILSGKGGTGKTFVSVNLAVAAKSAVYMDCDVEEPNGRIFLKPDAIEKKIVNILLPNFLEEQCKGCRKCVEFCKFNALVYIKDKPKVFREVCHSCGGCALVCPTHAITEIDSPVGRIEKGHHKDIAVVTGLLNIGEVSGVPIIKRVLEEGDKIDKPVKIIDCPPGSACSVTESVENADYCLLVVEPTAFGFHNFRMVYELSRIMNKKCGIVINKQDMPYEPLEDFCKENKIPVLMRIPYSKEIAYLTADGKIASEEIKEVQIMFEELLCKIGGEMR